MRVSRRLGIAADGAYETRARPLGGNGALPIFGAASAARQSPSRPPSSGPARARRFHADGAGSAIDDKFYLASLAWEAGFMAWAAEAKAALDAERKASGGPGVEFCA